MNKCLKIIITIDCQADGQDGRPFGDHLLQNVIQKNARKYGLEGMAQPVAADKIKIIICGHKDHVDVFVDIIHKESPEAVGNIEIEPHLKDRNYRGIFRVLEQ